jgi:hypothetical protein
MILCKFALILLSTNFIYLVLYHTECSAMIVLAQGPVPASSYIDFLVRNGRHLIIPRLALCNWPRRLNVIERS